ncbi:hypothetical protein K501DRAFT_273242 [Backusella circina FSU 941]|nr:hypothetical protein K501DRAFT_273242 [Backusella circina FSU 941]
MVNCCFCGGSEKEEDNAPEIRMNFRSASEMDMIDRVPSDRATRGSDRATRGSDSTTRNSNTVYRLLFLIDMFIFACINKRCLESRTVFCNVDIITLLSSSMVVAIFPSLKWKTK